MGDSCPDEEEGSEECPINECIRAIETGDIALFKQSLAPNFDHQTVVELQLGALQRGHMAILQHLVENGYPLCAREDYYQRARIYGHFELLRPLRLLEDRVECWDQCRYNIR